MKFTCLRNTKSTYTRWSLVLAVWILCNVHAVAQQPEIAIPLITDGADGTDSIDSADSAAPNAGGQVELDLELEVDEDEDEEGLGELGDLLDMADADIGSLSQVQVSRPSVAPALDAVVSTVERKESTVGRTPAAVYVINREMIRRSGARYVPEVLRTVPGVQVAQIDSNKWAVSIRGFNSRFANKLLVQVDGRSVYNPLFGGVFWDAQGLLMEDVERIEVIRGPGGAVWGDNAVNGVINIVTRSAKDTHGTYVEAGGGTSVQESFAAMRHGGAIGENADLRVFGQWSERGAFESPTDHDGWRTGQVGARLDWKLDQYDSFTIQGDFYDGESGTVGVLAAAGAPFAELRAYDENIAGGNVLFRWNRKLSADSDWQLQSYYEQTSRHFSNGQTAYDRSTYDIDFQHRFQANQNHEFVWGASYRGYRDELAPQPYFLSATPQQASYDVVGAFVQDTIGLVDDRLALTLGTKLSHNDFTGGEIQPSARLLWTPSDRASGWLAASRAVRTATRLTRDAHVILPATGTVAPPGVYPMINGQHGIEAEDVFSLEAGFRHQPISEFSWDAAVFWNQYEDLVGLGTPGPPGFDPMTGSFVPIPFSNSGRATTYGLELATTWQIHEDWSLRAGYSFLKMNFDGSVLGNPTDAPQNTYSLQSSHHLADNVQMDLIWRFVDSLPGQGVESYSSFNARAAWQATENLDLFVMGTNLFDSRHFEFGNDPFAGTQATAVPRGVFGGMTLRF